jgi:hypothetical protein
MLVDVEEGLGVCRCIGVAIECITGGGEEDKRFVVVDGTK